MGWFSRTDNGFFIATVVPDNDAARVARYLGVVHGEAIIGANIFRDLFSSVRDVVGGDFDYEVLGEMNGMMMVAVGGTAVKMA